MLVRLLADRVGAEERAGRDVARALDDLGTLRKRRSAIQVARVRPLYRPGVRGASEDDHVRLVGGLLAGQEEALERELGERRERLREAQTARSAVEALMERRRRALFLREHIAESGDFATAGLGARERCVQEGQTIPP